jgi:hypothetical protein
VPEEPKKRYQDPKTSAHFDFDYMCGKILQLMATRKLAWQTESEEEPI